MSPKDYFRCVLFSQEGRFAQANSNHTPSLAIIDPHCTTTHIQLRKTPSAVSFPSSISTEVPHDSSEATIRVSRRHIIIHDVALCGPSIQCELRRSRCTARLPGVSAEALNIPRAHVVPSSRSPIPYDLSAMWARPLSAGTLVGLGDRLWLDGLGEIVLTEEEDSCELSPYWCFFSAQTVYNGVIHIAIEWRYIQLTPEEYEHRVSSLLGGWMFWGRVVADQFRRVFSCGGGSLWV